MITVDKVAERLGLFDTSSDEIAYMPYRMVDTEIMIGVPPAPARGVDFVAARYLAPQSKLFQCLTGSGVFVSNENTSGVIEIGVQNGSVTQGYIDLMQVTGIPFPIQITDLSSGGTSTVVATGCRLLEIPEWRRDAFPGIVVYAFTSSRLFINHGLRLPIIIT